MIRISKAVNRRTFLKNGLSFFVANLFSLPLSNAFASSRACFIPRLAIIIDDIGFSRSRAELFLQPEIPLTFSILPRLSKSRALAEELHAQGHEIMLHQPMEPSGSIYDPGPGAVYVGDDPEIITGQIRKNIADTPFITGVNNKRKRTFFYRQSYNRQFNWIPDCQGTWNDSSPEKPLFRSPERRESYSGPASES
ncbi:MAG: divergent polysaccharide deacetylase family protein [Deltaproteobacteria bacterium]|nr:divergent polysaccharide deacetylase family protein [Deltaproteobacteria bacterium]